jgi:mono/diheme cytochrome c family protein
MNQDQKKSVNEKYARSLQKGERFWPDSIYKDLLVSLAIFILLILLASFVGVPFEPKADPSDSAYVPRPEWYFLFLFKFLALYGQIPLLGKIEWLATVLIPGLTIAFLFLLPFVDRSPKRYYGKRIFAIGFMAIVVTSIVSLTLIANIPTTSSDAVYIPGPLQTVGGLLIPLVGYILLALMNFFFKKTPAKVMIWTAAVTVILMIGLTVATLAVAPAPAAAEGGIAVTLVDQIQAGQDLYSANCVECHGDDGSVAVIEGVKGLEGEKITPINGRDVLYTITDSAMQEVIAYGRPTAGMNPFGRSYGGALSTSEISYMVTFMRYSWDDRFEMPPMKPLYPALAAGEVPSYDVHVQPLVKRYCISCHKAGKTNNNYLMTSYDEMLNTGDNVPVIKVGDENSLLLQLLNGHESKDPKTGNTIRQMPPTKLLKPEYIDMLTRWVMAGMPQTAEEAAKLSVTPTPTP